MYVNFTNKSKCQTPASPNRHHIPLRSTLEGNNEHKNKNNFFLAGLELPEYQPAKSAILIKKMFYSDTVFIHHNVWVKYVIYSELRNNCKVTFSMYLVFFVQRKKIGDHKHLSVTNINKEMVKEANDCSM